MTLNASEVKELAKNFGADLVGIASAQTLNAFPPDPRWPQTPDRISILSSSFLWEVNFDLPGRLKSMSDCIIFCEKV